MRQHLRIIARFLPAAIDCSPMLPAQRKRGVIAIDKSEAPWIALPSRAT